MSIFNAISQKLQPSQSDVTTLLHFLKKQTA
jgi:hypothetical protein